MEHVQANESGSNVECAARGLKLDELEVSSLRGTVEEASLQLDLASRLGRGAWAVQVWAFCWLQFTCDWMARLVMAPAALSTTVAAAHAWMCPANWASR